MDTAAKTVDLKVNKDLLDAKFDGYKLALDPLPVKSRELKEGSGIISSKSSDDGLGTRP